jgi:hypothetical protein
MKGRLKGNVVNAFNTWNDCTKAEA